MKHFTETHSSYFYLIKWQPLQFDCIKPYHDCVLLWYIMQLSDLALTSAFGLKFLFMIIRMLIVWFVLFLIQRHWTTVPMMHHLDLEQSASQTCWFWFLEWLWMSEQRKLSVTLTSLLVIEGCQLSLCNMHTNYGFHSVESVAATRGNLDRSLKHHIIQCIFSGF